MKRFATTFTLILMVAACSSGPPEPPPPEPDLSFPDEVDLVVELPRLAGGAARRPGPARRAHGPALRSRGRGAPREPGGRAGLGAPPVAPPAPAPGADGL